MVGVQKRRESNHVGENPLNVNMCLVFNFIFQETGVLETYLKILLPRKHDKCAILSHKQ